MNMALYGMLGNTKSQNEKLSMLYIKDMSIIKIIIKFFFTLSANI